MSPSLSSLVLLVLLLPSCPALYSPPPCSLPGMKVGAGLGTVAGAVGGVAATGGSATLATCPSLMVSTLGHGLMGPAGPLIALIAGALLGGVAGGTAGGVVACHAEGDHYVIELPPAHYNHHVHPPYEYYKYPVYSYLQRKYGQNDRVDNTTEQVRPEVAQWLSKYLIKQKDSHTLLVFPRPGSEAAKTDQDDSEPETEDSQQEERSPHGRQSVKEKHDKIIKLKKLLEMKLKRKLNYKIDIKKEEFNPSPKI